MNKPTLSIVVPCFNEEKVLPETIRKLSHILNKLKKESEISEDSFILFVDDGSKDSTWECIVRSKSDFIKGMKLSNNFGHQNALLAGLMHAKEISEVTISLDADLQQDEKAIYGFIQQYKNGYDIVFGVRKDRKSDNFLKRLNARFFYRLMQWMGVRLIPNHADYRLTSQKVLIELANYREYNLFLRGLFPILGFNSTSVEHEVRKRPAGKSKYSFKKTLSFALTGITSFSIMPLRVIMALGTGFFCFSLAMSIYVFYVYLTKNAVPGWASTVIPIYFIGGTQLFCLGALGEYIGKIYLETKCRPKYIIEKIL